MLRRQARGALQGLERAARITQGVAQQARALAQQRRDPGGLQPLQVRQLLEGARLDGRLPRRARERVQLCQQRVTTID